jgi:hypothetical protein
MKRIKIVGMCLVAVFALSALVASSASAAPEYKTCVKAGHRRGIREQDLCRRGRKIERHHEVQARRLQQRQRQTGDQGQGFRTGQPADLPRPQRGCRLRQMHRGKVVRHHHRSQHLDVNR